MTLFWTSRQFTEFKNSNPYRNLSSISLSKREFKKDIIKNEERKTQHKFHKGTGEQHCVPVPPTPIVW